MSARRMIRPAGARGRELWFRWHLHPWGLVVAVIMFTLGLTPSLLPRDYLYQALISGLAAGIGYALGLFAHVLWEVLLRPRITATWGPDRPRLSETARIRIEVALLLAGLVVVAAVVVVSLRWQRATARLTGAEAYTLAEYWPVLPLGLLIFLGTVLGGRLLTSAARQVARALPGEGERAWRGVAGWALVLLIVLTVAEEVIPGTIVRAGEVVFSERDLHPDPGVHAPEAPERSGSPASPVEWEKMGTHGSRFTAAGLDAGQLRRITGRESKEPIRVYAGLRNAPDIDDRARLLIDELERTGAKHREAILLAMSTGTGWVDAWTPQAFELIHDGDTAVVSAQYSYLPSALHFLAGGEAVREAGRALITPVVDWWNSLPEDDRPKLYLYGESLGTTAVESAFSGMRDIANSVDGILLAGPPNFNPLWSSFVARRDPGTREVDPEFAGGVIVRFAQTAAEIRAEARDAAEGGAPWGPTRMLYVQRASDPVVWWSESLMLRKPDWLREAPGVDRFGGFRWLPFITFLQVAADLPVSKNVPQGHGHNYGDALIDGFLAIDSDAPFDADRAERLNEQLRAAMRVPNPSQLG